MISPQKVNSTQFRRIKKRLLLQGIISCGWIFETKISIHHHRMLKKWYAISNHFVLSTDCFLAFLAHVFFLPSSSMKEPCFFERSPPRTLVSNRSSGDLSACKNLADSSDIRNIDMWYECRLLKHAKAARYDTMFLIYGIWAVNLIIVVNLIHLFLYILLQHNLQFHVKPNVPERVWSRPLHPPTPKWKDLDLFKRNVGQGIR